MHRKHTGAGTWLNTKEIRYVDGTINFYFYQGYGSVPRRWRISKSVDPYDNHTNYVYSGGRLARIEYPDGIDEVFNFSPTWIGTALWPAIDYSGVEVYYQDRATQQVIPGRGRQYIYHKRGRVNHGTVPINPATLAPFETAPFNGDLLYRAYVQAGRRLAPLTDAYANELYAVPSGLDAPERWEVTQYAYVTGTALVQSISHLVSDGVLSSTETTAEPAVTYAYQGVGNRARVQFETLHLQGITYTYAYSLRSQVDEYNQQSVELTTKTGSDGSHVVYSMDTRGRVTSVKVWPRVGSGVVDRAADPAYDPAYDSQPTYLETIYEYDSLFCGCNGKPTAVVRMPANRRTEYDYEQTTGLLLEIREPNPSGSGAPAVTKYDWEPAVSGQPHGRWRLKNMTRPDGQQWSWLFPAEVDRMDTAWGTKSQVVVASSPTVSLSTPAPQVYSTSLVFNINSPDQSSGSQLELVGQIEQSTDEDGIATAFTYDDYGRLKSVTRNPGGALGDEELKTVYVRDRWGDVSTVTESAGSGLPLTTHYTRDAGGRIAKVDANINGITHARRLYYDHWGNLGAVWTSNKTANGGTPDDFDPNGQRSDIARDWIREEWHYVGGRLASHFSDRRELDRDDTGAIADAADARYLRTDYTWQPSGLLAQVGNSNGSTNDLSYDEFGDLFTVVRNGTGQSVLVTRRFVNAALETSRVIDGLGQVTVTERNTAGRVWRITAPSNAVPAGGYPWGTTAAAAVTELGIDVMGRVCETLIRELGGSTPLVRYKSLYDEIGRAYASETFEAAAVTAIQYTTTLWNGASTIEKVTYPGQRCVQYEYDSLLRVRETRDGLASNPNKIVYSYEPKTPYLTKAESWGWDSAAATPGYVKRPVEYVRDNLGRTLQLKVMPSDPLPSGASSTPLVHWFSYYTAGGTESYTDPSGKIEHYLPDGEGRLAERFLPGSDPIWNGAQFVDWLSANERTEMVQLDGRSRVTRTIYDFAGRPIVVMEPGASTEPTDTAKHQPFARWIEYDAASRVSDIYAGDGVHVAFARDAQGRVLKRSGAGAQWVSLFHEIDWFQRDALGQVVETQTFGGGALLSAERFTRDVLGRTHEESFAYWPGFANWTDTESSFAGGDPLRTGVAYANNLTGKVDDVWMDLRNDMAGRLDRVQWKVGEFDPWKAVATYKYEGPRTRERQTTSLTTSASFQTSYSYDQYGRMAAIGQSFDVNAGVEFYLDDASNLLKEEYKKQGAPTAKGDRFQNDEHHRLWKAWLGSNSTHFDQADPNVGVGDYVQRLTYALDSANNRNSVETQLGQGGPATTSEYTADDEDPSHPSNRYVEADGAKPLYDERGNTVFDGQRYYVYDSLNRLTEVYVVDEQQQATSGGGTQSAMMASSGPSGPAQLSSATSGPLVAVEDVTALRLARAKILQRLGGSAAEVLVRHGQPNFRMTASEPLSASVAQIVSPSGSGTTQTAPSGSSPLSAASSLSAPSFESLQLRLIALYLYDTYDRRVLRMVEGWPIYYYSWDGWEEAQEMVATFHGDDFVTRPVTQNVWGRELDEMAAYRNRWVALSGAVGPWNDYYIAEGGAHCPSRVLDAAGNVVEIQEYDPYGKTTFFSGSGTLRGEYSDNAIWNRFHWKGHRVDWETGLVYLRHRYYSAQWGRFLSSDPLGVWGDPASRGSSYAYGASAPTVYGDRYGLQISSDLQAAADRHGLSEPGASYRFAEPQRSWSGVEYSYVIIDDCGKPYAATAAGSRVLFPWQDYLSRWQHYERQLFFFAHGASLGVASVFVDTPQPESASDSLNAIAGAIVTGRLIGEAIAEASPAAPAAEAPSEKLYHYTSDENASSIMENGLRPGATGKVFLTPDGSLSPTEAQQVLALGSPNPPSALIQVDAGALAADGVMPSSGPTTVAATPGQPGGGQEVIYQVIIMTQYLWRIR